MALLVNYAEMTQEQFVHSHLQAHSTSSETEAFLSLLSSVAAANPSSESVGSSTPARSPSALSLISIADQEELPILRKQFCRDLHDLVASVVETSHVRCLKLIAVRAEVRLL